MNTYSSMLLTKLKEATASKHSALEALPCQQLFLTDECCLHDYSHILFAYARAISTVDSFLQSYHWPIDCVYHSRLPLLNQDLWRLFHDWNDMFSSPLPLQDLSLNAWGLRYVIEGMALGAHWMLKKSPIFQNPKVIEATAFFQYRQTHWPQFCSELEKACSEAAVQQSVINSACWMFQQFHLALTENVNNTTSRDCFEYRFSRR